MRLRQLLPVLLISTLGCTRGTETPPSAPASGPGSAPSGDRHGGYDKSFDGAEKWAERFDDPERDAWQKPKHVVALLELSPGAKVADLGAGTGYFLPHLAAAVQPGGSVVGLDVEADMVRYMRERIERETIPGATAREVPPDDPRLEPGSMDAVLIVDTWHHISDRKAYAKKLAAGLAPGGAVYVVDFTLDSPSGPPKHHRVSPELVSEELAAGGLSTEVLTETLPRQFVVVGRKATDATEVAPEGRR